MLITAVLIFILFSSTFLYAISLDQAFARLVPSNELLNVVSTTASAVNATIDEPNIPIGPAEEEPEDNISENDADDDGDDGAGSGGGSGGGNVSPVLNRLQP
jgi:hypothetical protein